MASTHLHNRNVLLLGSALPPCENIHLQAGPLNMLFNPEDGFLRQIRLGGSEVLNGIYAAVRNQNWDTVPPKISALSVQQTAGTFEVAFVASCMQDDAHYEWLGRITGDAAGNINYTFEGQALSSFKKNRTGFCILHPMLLAGSPVTVLHCDGRSEQGRFPHDISAHQPYKDIRSLTHEVSSGIHAEVLMEGDSFEMEDQRNWTDASYKTYCTPLAQPFPVLLKKGETLRQRVALRLHCSTAPAAAGSSSPAIRVSLPEGAEVPLPKLGLGCPDPAMPLHARERVLLQQLRLHHLRVDIKTYEADAASLLARGIAQAQDCGAGVELALFAGADPGAELRRLSTQLMQARAVLCSIIIFQRDHKTTPASDMQTCHDFLRALPLDCPLGGGTNAYFAEYNRQQPPFAGMDFSCFSINPQVHAFDHLSLVETLPAQAVALSCARAMSGGRPVHVTPITLRPRFNPNATAMVEHVDKNSLPPTVDVRQLSLFGAAWTLGSIQQLTHAGADSLTCYETVGWRGLMETRAGAPMPEHFPSAPGQVFAVYHIFRAIADYQGGHVLPSMTSHALILQSLLLARGHERRLILSNTSAQLQCAVLAWENMPDTLEMRHLDELNRGDWLERPEDFWARPGQMLETRRLSVPVSLLPFATVILDFTN